MEKYIVATFSWVIGIQAEPDATTEEIVSQAKSRVAETYPGTTEDGKIHLGDYMCATYERRPDAKARMSIVVLDDNEEEAELGMVPYLVCFDQCIAIAAKTGITEREIRQEAEAYINQKYHSLQELLDAEDTIDPITKVN